VNPSVVDRFLHGVITGANLDADSPALAFRNFLLSDQSSFYTASGAKSLRTGFAFIVLNSLRRFTLGEGSKCVHTGSRGYVFFAMKQPDNLNKVAKVFFSEPAKLVEEPDQPLRKGVRRMENVASRFVRDTNDAQAAHVVKDAKDIGGITPKAREYLDGIQDRERRLGGKSRIDYMRERVKSGALEGGVR
jgi:hypothetical protein